MSKIINYLKNLINKYIYNMFPPEYLQLHQHYYDNKEYIIKNTVYKNGKVQPSSPDKI